MLHYLLKNIKNIITKEKFLFTIIIIVQIISVVTIMFSYGIIKHYGIKNEVAQSTLLEMDLKFPIDSEDDIVTADKMLEYHSMLIESVKGKISYEYVMSSCSGYMIDSTLNYSNGNIINGESDENREYAISTGGRNFTDEEKRNGSKVVIVCAGDRKKYTNDTLVLGNENYNIIGYAHENMVTEESDPFLEIPVMSLPGNAKIRHIIMEFDSPIDKNEYDTLKDVCLNAFSDKVEIPEFVGISDVEDTKSNNTIILSGIILIIFAAVNYCIMYRYILEKRKRTLAIYRICGCTKVRAAFVYIVELFGVSIFIFAMLIPVYHCLILPRISRIFEYMRPYYNNKIYINLLLGYGAGLFVSYVILVTGIVKKTPLMLTKEGEI